MNLKFTTPTKWNQLSPWQLRIIGHILSSDSNLEKKFLQRIIVFILLVKKPSFKFIAKAVFLFFRRSFNDFSYIGDFIFSENDNLTKFPERIKVGSFFKRKTLVGPAIRLSNISIEELSYADAFFFNWITESKSEDLQRLTACLYRLADNKEPSDIREPFNRLLLPQNSELTDKISMGTQYIIALAYQGSRNTFMDKFPNVFPKPRKSEEEDEKPKVAKPIRYTPFTKIINAMAMDETQVFGTLQQTEKTNALKFLEIYETQIINAHKK